MRSAAAGERAARQADARTYCRTLVTSQQGARGRADSGAYDSALHRIVGGSLISSFPADLRMRVHPAILIIETELVEALAGSRKDENPGASGRRRGARGEQQDCGAQSDDLHFAGGGAGGTRCQPLGHSFTYG